MKLKTRVLCEAISEGVDCRNLEIGRVEEWSQFGYIVD